MTTAHKFPSLVGGPRLVGDPLKLGRPGHDAEVLNVGVGNVPALQHRVHADLLGAAQRLVQVVGPGLGPVGEVPESGDGSAFRLDQGARR